MSMTRWLVRIALIVAIFWIALMQGFEGAQLTGLVLAIAWALLLPVIMAWLWRRTSEWEPWQRYLALGAAALLLLAAFAVGVRPLLGV